MTSGVNTAKVHEPAHLALANVQGRRCRMQGLDDASLHYGWVDEAGKNTIHISVHSNKPVRAGEFLYFEVSAKSQLLTFVGWVVSVDRSVLKVRVTSQIEERALATESRLKKEVLPGEVSVGREFQEIALCDISKNGFGFSSPIHLEPNKLMGFSIKTGFGNVLIQAEVRHSRKLKDSDDFRAGAQIVAMDRVSRARWSRILME